MSDAERIMKSKAALMAEIDKALPEERSEVLRREATKRLEGILERYAGLPDGMRMHTEKRIFPSAAVYLTLKEQIGQERAFCVIEDAAKVICAGTERKLIRLMRLPGMKGLFIRIWDPMTKKLFGPANGFKNVFYPKRKGEYRMDVVSCPYFRYFTELGCPELTRIFCENDERIYGHLPGLLFERKGTLGKGAKKCDFRLARK